MEADHIERAAGRAMSCALRVVVVGGDPLTGSPTSAGSALARLAELDARWSRFRDSSEVSRLNAASGQPCVVSPETLDLVVAMVEGWHVTLGAFDPTLLVPLVGLGYAASREDATRRTSLPAGARVQGRPAEILVDREHDVVQLPRGTTLDPGGVGKGLAADLVVDELLGAGAAGALVEVGGDLRVAGVSPSGGAWPIAVEDGPAAEAITLAATRLALSSGGVATSSTRVRTWTRGGRSLHHLLDPSTLNPTEGAVETATVIAGSAGWAEALTKSAFVKPLDEALDLYERLGVGARVATSDGAHRHTTAWHQFAAVAPVEPLDDFVAGGFR